MGPPAHSAPRYWSLDILRGVCALSVFLNHCVLWSNFAPVGVVESWLFRWLGWAYEAFIILVWPTGGQHPAVLCFFVLSGFCVHAPFERRIGHFGSVEVWRDYFIRRTRRIMPVYWTGALLGLLVVAAVRYRSTVDPLLSLHASATLGGIAARLGGFSGLWFEEVFAGNYTLGTVAVEILIYLAYPLFFRGAKAGRWRLLGAVVVGLQLLALLLQPYLNPFVLFSGVLVMALFWYLGALAAHLRQKHDWRISGWWLGAGWGIFLILKTVPHFYGLNMLKQTVWGVLCMGLIVWLLDWESRHDAQRERIWARLLRWTGEISYSLYAIHTPVILLVNWVMLTVVFSHSYVWQLGLNLVLGLVVSVVVHRTIEKRFYRHHT